MTPPPLSIEEIDRLRKLLERELPAAERLLSVLNDEISAIGGQDPNKLEALTRQKRQAISEIEQLEQDRSAHLRACGITDESDALAELFAAVAPDCGVIWERLLTTARQCRDKNEAVGHLLRVHSQFTGQLLEVLTGKMPGGDIYGPKGRKKSTTDGHSLAKA